MPRFLTPSRICLLALIDLYLSNQIALSTKVELLSFIAQHIRQPTSQENELTVSDTSHLSISGDATAFAASLTPLASIIPGRNIYDILLPKLWQLTSLDTLNVLFEGFANLFPDSELTGEVVKFKISRASPLGQYIRRCCVEFTRLQFADSQVLWNAFEAYRQPTYDAWAARNSGAAIKFEASRASISAMSSAIRLANAISTPTESYISAEDTDRLITFSIHQLQKLGTRMPEDAKNTLRQWITDQSESGLQSLQHFLAFFESWRAGQYTMALENLHRYFDYSLAAKNVSVRRDESMRVYYQYALLHLSVLHADFDCWAESVDAMEECIATARENQDTACLNFALSWLLYLRQASSHHNSTLFESVGGLNGGASGGQDEIAFLKTKSKETKNWSLLSSTLLEEAKLEMYASGSNIKSLEHILQSGHLNIQHDLWSLMPASALFQSASFDRTGQVHLSMRLFESIAVVHKDHCPLGDRVRAECRIAYTLAQRGHYDSALHTLDSLAPAVEGVLRLEQRVLGYSYLVHVIRKIRCSDLIAAGHHFSQLRILRSFTDPELAFEISMIEIDLLIEREHFHAAIEVVDKHLQRFKMSPWSDIAQRLHLLVAKAKIFTSASQPARAFSIALRAASTAHRLLIIPVMLEASAILAYILCDLNEFDASIALIESLLPTLIEAKNLRLTAELYAASASAHVGRAGALPVAERAKVMSAAEECVEKGRDTYAKLKSLSGVLDCLTMKARIARWRGDEATATLAEEIAMQHLVTHENGRT